MISLGNRRELFVDHFLLDRLEQCRLLLHRPVAANVALTFDRPWEGRFVGYATVIPDAAMGLVRLYYRGWPDVNSPSEDVSYCYAESRDGRCFTRPDLGLFEYHGERQTNLIFKGGDPCHSFSPMLDERPGCPAGERFKGLGLGDQMVAGKRRSVLYAYVSPDGMRWHLLRPEPVLTQGAFDSQNLAFWSTHEGCYVAYYRTARRNTTPSTGTDKIAWRTISRAVSDDFVNWRDETEMTYGETPLEELYTNQTQPYFRAPHLSLAFPKRLNVGRRVLTAAEAAAFAHHPQYLGDVSDGVFMSTRGGNRYDRTFMEAYLRPGPDRANWCSRTNMSALGLVQTGLRELSLYYQHRYAAPSAYLQRYVLDLDRFASINGPYAGGEAVTKPFTHSGSRLLLNYATSGAGGLRVELQDAAGQPLPGYTLADCTPLVGDEIEGQVRWGERHDLRALAGQPLRLRLHLRDADLWALRFA